MVTSGIKSITTNIMVLFSKYTVVTHGKKIINTLANVFLDFLHVATGFSYLLILQWFGIIKVVEQN